MEIINIIHDLINNENNDFTVLIADRDVSDCYTHSKPNIKPINNHKKHYVQHLLYHYTKHLLFIIFHTKQITY